MLKNKLFYLIICAAMFFLGCILIALLMSFNQNPYKLVAAVGVLLFAGILGLYYFIYNKKVSINRPAFIVGLILATFLTRLLWVVFVDTVPISDFLSYHDYAANVSKGEFRVYDGVFPLFPFKFGYPLVLSLLYSLFGAKLLVAKLFHVAISSLIALLIYWITVSVFNERAGRIAAILFSLWPTQIMYNSVLASEHVFMLFLVLALALFINLKQHFFKARGLFLAVSIGILLAMAQYIRPLSTMIFPILIFYTYVFLELDVPLKRSIVHKTKIIAVMLMVYAVSVCAINYPLEKKIGVPLWKSSSGFSFLIGTNSKSLGFWNPTDAGIIKEFDFNFEKVHGEAGKRAVERIMSDPVSFVKLAVSKFTLQWSDETYGLTWSTYKIGSENGFTKALKHYSTTVNAVCQFFYIILLVCMLAGCVYAIKNKIYASSVFLLFFLGLVAAHTLFETQARYHYPAVLLLVIIGGYGMERLLNRFLNPGNRVSTHKTV